MGQSRSSMWGLVRNWRKLGKFPTVTTYPWQKFGKWHSKVFQKKNSKSSLALKGPRKKSLSFWLAGKNGQIIDSTLFKIVKQKWQRLNFKSGLEGGLVWPQRSSEIWAILRSKSTMEAGTTGWPKKGPSNCSKKNTIKLRDGSKEGHICFCSSCKILDFVSYVFPRIIADIHWNCIIWIITVHWIHAHCLYCIMIKWFSSRKWEHNH